MKTLLKSRKGVALELAVTTLLFVFALCTLLTYISLRDVTASKYWKEGYITRQEVRQIAEGYLSYLQGDTADGFVLSEDLEDKYYTVKRSNDKIYVLEIYKTENDRFCFRATFRKDDNNVTVSQWNYMDTGSNASRYETEKITKLIAGTRVFQQPAEANAVVDTIVAGAEVVLLESETPENGYYYVKYNENYGYISQENIEDIKCSFTVNQDITENAVTENPSSDINPSVVTLAENSPVELVADKYDRSCNYTVIKYNEKEHYIKTADIKYDGTIKTVNGINLREKPNTESNLLSKLQNGTVVTLLSNQIFKDKNASDSFEFYYVEVVVEVEENGEKRTEKKNGYVVKDYVLTGQPVTIISTDVLTNDAPKNNVVIVELKENTPLEILRDEGEDEESEFWHIRVTDNNGNIEGYIKKDFVLYTKTAKTNSATELLTFAREKNEGIQVTEETVCKVDHNKDYNDFLCIQYGENQTGYVKTDDIKTETYIIAKGSGNRLYQSASDETGTVIEGNSRWSVIDEATVGYYHVVSTVDENTVGYIKKSIYQS